MVGNFGLSNQSCLKYFGRYGEEIRGRGGGVNMNKG